MNKDEDIINEKEGELKIVKIIERKVNSEKTKVEINKKSDNRKICFWKSTKKKEKIKQEYIDNQKKKNKKGEIEQQKNDKIKRRRKKILKM